MIVLHIIKVTNIKNNLNQTPNIIIIIKAFNLLTKRNHHRFDEFHLN